MTTTTDLRAATAVMRGAEVYPIGLLADLTQFVHNPDRPEARRRMLAALRRLADHAPGPPLGHSSRLLPRLPRRTPLVAPLRQRLVAGAGVQGSAAALGRGRHRTGGDVTAVDRWACRNCRRPLHWVPGIGWLHGELPQYAGEELTCERPEPVCSPRPFTKADPECERRHIATGPDVSCPCGCHQSAPERPRR